MDRMPTGSSQHYTTENQQHQNFWVELYSPLLRLGSGVSLWTHVWNTPSLARDDISGDRGNFRMWHSAKKVEQH